MSSGGRRPGAGRKATGKATTTVAFRVSQETKKKIVELKARGIDVRALFEDMIKGLAE